jgi:hypothetical protein
MLNHLKLQNVGPAPAMELDLGERLNLITGDNGLGKTFLLDIAWWSLTRRWPAEINPKLTAGKKALPSFSGDASISFAFAGKTREESYESTYQRKEQAWTGRPGRPANPGLVLYAMTDGSFAVWDPHRNYWRTQNGIDVQDRLPAYVFSPTEVWDGQPNPRGGWICNGLIRDWASWQKERGPAFEQLTAVLRSLSATDSEPMVPGRLTRVDFDDVQDMPTLSMPYGQDVPVVHVSSGMRRIIALAYLLVWAWNEHSKAAEQIGEEFTDQIVFLIDEIEAHLHPAWQRTVVPGILSVMELLSVKASVQLITATHSPLVMTSVEPFFDEKSDAWFDLDFEDKQVVIRRRPFEKHGDAGIWLISNAFDLPSRRSLEYEKLIREASQMMAQNHVSSEQILAMHERLVTALNPKDEFLFTWKFVCHKKGWISSESAVGGSDTEDSTNHILPAGISDTRGWSDERIRRQLSVIKAELGWNETTGSARKWWETFEAENANRLSLALRLSEELRVRKATITEFFLAYVYSNTDNIQACLHYLDYTRLKKANKTAARANSDSEPSEGGPIDRSLDGA